MLRPMLLTVLVAAGFAIAEPPPSGTSPSKTTEPKKVEPKKAEPTIKSPKESSASLTVGSKAPEIKVSKWVKGTEVKSFEPGKAYVVEFWATWCGPCKKSIPHLNDLAKEHKDLTVVGVSVWEEAHKKTLADVENFVKGKGDGMSYNVAFDGNKVMEKTWMAAAGLGGIPSAFVIGGDGNVTWIGNPLSPDFTTAVEDALKGAAGSKQSKPQTTTPSTKPTDTKPADSKPAGAKPKN